MALLSVHGGGPVPAHVHGAVVPAHVAAGGRVLEGVGAVVVALAAAHARVVAAAAVGPAAVVEPVLAAGDGLEREELLVVAAAVGAEAVLGAGDLGENAWGVNLL